VVYTFWPLSIEAFNPVAGAGLDWNELAITSMQRAAKEIDFISTVNQIARAGAMNQVFYL
jgi:hypothetical protein